MKKCYDCGSLVIEAESKCGVCGGSHFVPVESGPGSPPLQSTMTQRRLHYTGVIVLLVGSALIVVGLAMMELPEAPIGFLLLFLGIATVGSVLGVFRGIPYRPNLGEHRGGDPDVWGTRVTGSRPSSETMYLADRQADETRRQEETD